PRAGARLVVEAAVAELRRDLAGPLRHGEVAERGRAGERRRRAVERVAEPGRAARLELAARAREPLEGRARRRAGLELAGRLRQLERRLPAVVGRRELGRLHGEEAGGV